MLSRISSFSGPLSKLFNSIKGFIIPGLILRYELSDMDSYSGTSTVTDLVGNSNATVINGPTYSINGYLNFDGVNDYVMTNTSLNSKLSPVNTSTVISYFLWIYPMDDGVIITEQGSSSLNTSWHDSQIEIVSGVLKFRVWQNVSIISSISISLNRWYYVGLTYDGITLKGYVNNQLAGSTTGSRETPWNNGGNVGLFYGIGANDSTDLDGTIGSGPGGTYAKMKFGAFHVYNIALSQQQISNNYNVTKSNYIYTEDMLIWIDSNDSASYVSGSTITDISGNSYTHTLASNVTISSIYGFKSLNCSSLMNNYIRVNGTGPTLLTSGYTYVAWARITSDSSTWRTLYRSAANDHPLIVEIGTDNLGFYDNDTNSFRDSGYDVSSIEEKWIQYSVVGDSSSSQFYINDIQVGSVSYGAGGNKHDYFGAIDGQPFGYVGNMMLYNNKLTQAQIKQNYDALKHVYSNGDFVINNLVLYFNPKSLLSYPGSGTTIADLTDNSLDGSMSNISFTNPYLSFNGSSSTVLVSDNSLLEPGTGNFTVEVWINHSVITGSSRCILSKTDGANSADWGYGIRTNTAGLTYMEIGNGTTTLNSPTYTVTTNTWYQIVGVCNNTSNQILLYVNGTNQGTPTTNSFTSIKNTTHNISIGSFDNNIGGYGQWFNGKMGIVRMYNSALSASDVSKNFEANRAIYGI